VDDDPVADEQHLTGGEVHGSTKRKAAFRKLDQPSWP
jgi:hypothetical protein